MTNRIRFSVRWDKLDARTFTTFRRHRPDKEAYYRGLIGQRFDVVLEHNRGTPNFREELLGQALLWTVDVVNPRTVPRPRLELDVQHQLAVHPGWLAEILSMPRALCLTFDNLGDVPRGTSPPLVSPGQRAEGR